MTVWYISFIISSAVLITGGYGKVGTGIERTAELYLPKSKQSCKLPGLPIGRRDHSSDDALLCGGDYHDGMLEAATTCVQWRPDTGTWVRSHTLSMDPDDYRGYHVSWTPDNININGTYLMGGLPGNSYNRR